MYYYDDDAMKTIGTWSQGQVEIVILYVPFDFTILINIQDCICFKYL